MQKDIIYIDTEDDITSIIEKVKKSHNKVVALVPPKRVGSLQSIVNLKLLKRAASGAEKHIAIITSDRALMNLAGDIGVAVAKNLQSRPEVPMAHSLSTDDEEEIIDGMDIPVSSKSDQPNHARKIPVVSDAADKGNKKVATADDLATKPTEAAATSKKPNIPNFEKFRKKLFLIGGGVVALVLFLVWAIVFAPHAKLSITANTTGVNIAQTITLDPAATASDPTAGTFKTTVQQVKKSAQAQFTATGKKDIGKKATGTVNYTNNTVNSITVSAGDKLQTSNGLVFLATGTTVIPGAKLGTCPGGQACPVNGTAKGNVEAAEVGTNYNAASGNLNSSYRNLQSTFANPTSGGTSEIVTVVQQSDVDAAKEKLATNDSDSIKNELKLKYGKDMVVIDASFVAAAADPAISPAVGERATEATITVETTYTLMGVSRNEMKAYLNAQMKSEVDGKENQRIYSSGDESIVFTQFAAAGATSTVALNTTGQIGPNINTDQLKEQVKGKRLGEVQQLMKNYDGVEDITVDFSPFWVTKVPSPDKTEVTFEIKNADQ